MTRFELSEIQAQAILDLRLQRLTQLEAGKIEAEYDELQERIAELRAILGDEARVDALIREELLEIRGSYADERRTEIVPGEDDIDLEDMIAEEDMVIAISNGGYIKRLPVSTYREQRRGGKGLARGATQGRGLHRAPLRRLDARLPPLLHQRGQGLPPEGARAAARLARLARAPHRQPARPPARTSTSAP